MSYAPESYAERDLFAADATVDARVAFIRRTYAHLLGAVLVFTALCVVFVNVPAVVAPILGMIRAGQWWLVLVAYMAVSWIARSMAMGGASKGVQYAGLGLFVLAVSIIFAPLLWMASAGGQDTTLITQAASVTLIIFGGLTAVVMLTRADFSFLRYFLALCGLAALGLIAASFIGGFSLGIWFVIGMIVLMCGYILYDTSNVLHHFHTDQHVAASLALFASLATLFWYVLQLMSILGDD